MLKQYQTLPTLKLGKVRRATINYINVIKRDYVHCLVFMKEDLKRSSCSDVGVDVGRVVPDASPLPPHPFLPQIPAWVTHPPHRFVAVAIVAPFL